MVFIAGPRQVGKTTLARSLLPEDDDRSGYLNWDIVRDRQQIRSAEFPVEPKLMVLDEIHKFRRWRGLVKGLYDQYFPEKNFIVTGSARLDYYRKGGDSLHGRYHYWRLHPLSLGELRSKDALRDLLEYGGFPEPFQKAERRFWRRWSRERLHRVIQEDVRDLENVKDLSLLELLMDELPRRASNLLSLHAIAEDLQVSPRSVDRWIEIFERLYVTFRIAPYGPPRIKAIKKSRKLYLWDWGSIEKEGARFENLVAAQLLKYCHFQEDREGYRMELRFLRDRTGKEIDFVILQDRKPLFGVECKTGEKELSDQIRYFQPRTPIPMFYQVHLGTKDYGNEKKGVRVLPFSTFVEVLNLP
ncbi:ATP-binding protein [bacterium]|nr:ATP-binding protein [bacterium]